MKTDVKKNSPQRILVTGASSGIGAAITASLAAPGVSIGIHYHRNSAGAGAVAETATAAGATIALLPADLSTVEGRAALPALVEEQLGGCDVLINNAGGPLMMRQFGDYSEADIDAILGLNYVAPLFLCQAFFPVMCRQGYGRIINISSIGIKFGGGIETAVYSSAKSALEVLTVNLSKQGALHNVTVNTVRAGVIDTPQHEAFGKDLDARRQLIPMQRLGTPDEIAAMVAYLVGDTADFITGQTFSVSGGE